MKLVENREKKKKIIVNDLGLFIQVILMFYSILIGILTMIKVEFLPMLELLLGISLLTMAYNNKKTYKRKVLTIPYIVVGLFLITYAIIAYVKLVF